MKTEFKYSFSHIAEIINGTLTGAGDQIISHLVIDSRKILFPADSVFFAIEGAHHNGHDFIEQVYQAGVRCFIVSNPAKINLQACPHSTYVVVTDVLRALQKLAAYHRSRFHIPVVAITGSNGKTVVKDWLFHVLSPFYLVCRSPKSYNSQVGVPLSLWNLQPEDGIGIFEAGISEPGEMQHLEAMIRPEIGVFTNLGSAHGENFTSPIEKLYEKLALFTHCQTIIYCANQPAVAQAITQMYGHKNLVSWGRHTSCTWSYSVKPHAGGADVFLTDGTHQHVYAIPFADDASVENSIHVFICALALGAQPAHIISMMSSLHGVDMRLSFKTGRNGCFIIDDTYSNDIDSLKIALDSLMNLQQYPDKRVILSDILQSRLKDADLYQEIASIIRSKNIQAFIGIGKGLKNHRHLFGVEAKFFETTEEFLQHIRPDEFYSEAILIKGARIFGMEKIVHYLENKYHETVLEVNLNAMVRNLNYYRKMLPADTRVMAMVKASGYGTGTHEIAHILRFHHVDYLAVAYADEGLELRNHGIDLPMMVMNAEHTDFSLLAEKRLEPVMYSFESLKALQEHIRLGILAPPVHIELDTGMHRLGFMPSDLPELIRQLDAMRGIQVQSVFSHLAASDEESMDEFTRGQIATFSYMTDELHAQTGLSFIRHIANSAGASRFPEAAFDMIRLGVGLYGVGANTNEQLRLEPVIKLYSSIAQIKHIPAGDSIGYGRSYTAAKDITIAIVPIGYADGYKRSLGNGKGTMYVHGKPAPVAGRVCMDMTMIDVTGLDVKTGDRVEIIGEHMSIDQFARSIDTIPYEVLTSVSSRVKRIYVQD